MQRFILIDGNAILHRAYHALPPLTNKKGEPVNAVYGFSSMLLKVIADLKPDYFSVAFDRPAPTFRQQLYVGYQAQRPKMEEELTSQVDLVHEVLSCAKIPIFEIDGYEADDVIGTLATQAAQKGAEVIIVSGDRDMLQLVNDQVRVYAPIIGLTKTILYDKEAVEQKYGVTPSQMIDYKALIGDPSDNYPGVSGIGPKTASQLLKKYGSLENLYKNIGQLPPKISAKLAVDAEQVSLAKKLATIVTDAPVSFDIEKCSFKNFDIKQTEEAFLELGFKSLLKRLPGNNVELLEPEKHKDENGQLELL